MQLDRLVDVEARTVSPHIYTDEAIYRQEQEQIFARCWQFVGMEAEIPGNNDFVTSWVGEEQVIVTRDGDGGIHVMLNSCTHRGVKVCRAEKGSAKTFTCPYHGWTYRNNGKLTGVPRFTESYHEEFDRSQYGLIEARVETLCGLIFACFDETAPSLDEYLGDMKYYLEFALNRTPGGWDMIAGTEKIIVPANWKLEADQFCGDNYHADYTHRSVLMIFPEAEFRDDSSTDNFTVRLPGGHGFYRVDSTTTEIPGAPEVAQYIRDVTEVRKSRMDERRAAMLGPGTTSIFTVFPNLSALSTPEFTQLRLMLPRGPHHQLLISWLVCDKEAPPAYREAAAKAAAFAFSAAGTFEADDGLCWTEATQTMKGTIRKRKPLPYFMGKGHEFEDAERPGIFAAVPNEDTVFGFYRGWLQTMQNGPQDNSNGQPVTAAIAA
jgi:3-phenylpropionate/trans-cinnamate dioxygenase alpha subunit